MPSRNPKITTDTRPSPKERAKALKAAAPKKSAASASAAIEAPMVTGAVVRDDGTVHYCDATGRALRKPVADWVGFMALRLSVQARKEMARQVNDPALAEKDRQSLALELRRKLRLDALHILTGRSDAAFEAALASENDLPEIPVRREPGAGVISPDLIRAVEAHREAVQLDILDPVADDVRRTAAERRIRALADAIRDTPARTPADLRHKLIYLWPGPLDEHVRSGALADTFQSFHDDAMRLAEATNDASGPDDVAVDFTPWDINGPCPVPLRDRWIEDAHTLLPWLRIGFLLLSLNRDGLKQHLKDMDDETFNDLVHTLSVAARNFDQLHRFVRLVQLRVDAALVDLTAEEQAAAAGAPARG